MRKFQGFILFYVAVLFFELAIGVASAADLNAWEFRQQVTLEQTGVVKIPLPVQLLDVAQPDFRDLRILDDHGNEVPYFLEAPRSRLSAVSPVKSFSSTVDNDATTILIDTGTKEPIDCILLSTPAPSFIKPVRIEGSNNNRDWKLLVEGRPIFREPNGIGNLEVNIDSGAWSHLRLTIDDSRSVAIPVTGVSMRTVVASSSSHLVPVKIVENTKSSGTNRVVVDLGFAHLPLASIRIESPDPLFKRQVFVATSQLEDNTAQERIFGRGLIYHMTVGSYPATNNSISLDIQTPSRQLIMLIEDGDNPPLNITSVDAEVRNVYVTFVAPATSLNFFTGNKLASSPRYDLAAMSANLRTIAPTSAQFSTLQPNPSFNGSATLPEIPNLGSEIDTRGWRYRKPVKIIEDGVQQLELDIAVLSHSKDDLSDLRLVKGNRQISFVLEHTSISRSVQPESSLLEDSKRPSVSRWRLKVPYQRLPFARLTCTITNQVFKRDVVLYEELKDERGEPYKRILSSGTWLRTPTLENSEFTLNISQRPQSDILYLEIDNQDNPHINAANFQLNYPVNRLLFKGANAGVTQLYYGNKHANSPTYDVQLVGERLLVSPKHIAEFGPEESLISDWTAGRMLKGKAGIVFWASLVLVVASLLVVITHLLPKNDTKTEPDQKPS